LFPPPQLAGTAVGTLSSQAAAESGLTGGTAVTIAGHDHLCAALAAGATEPGAVFDSMGTAETLLGALPQRPLGAAEFASGLTFGRHVVGGRHYWLGGLSMSGGSIEWLRGILGDPPLHYEEMARLLPHAPDSPGDLLYLPYLAGCSSPWPDPALRGAFIGLGRQHGRAQLLQAVLEGTAYQMEAIRRAAEHITETPIRRIVAAGGGTHNLPWLQIKADVSGCEHLLLSSAEATLLGAALLAGMCSGVFADEREALAAVSQRPLASIQPRPALHRQYQALYETQFLAWQKPLREYVGRPATDSEPSSKRSGRPSAARGR
jgi:xylulokinase